MRIPRHMLRDRITFEPYAAGGSRGPGYADPVGPVHASVQATTRLVMNPEGNEEVAAYVVLVRPELDIPMLSRVAIGAQAYRVLQAAPMPDEFRPTHQELVLGRLP